MENILKYVGSVLKDGLSLSLLGIGITFATHAYIGGLFLAFAGAAISRAWEKEQARKQGLEVSPESWTTFSLVLVTAFFISTIVAIVTHSQFPEWPVQLVMAIAGFGSRKLVVLLMNTVNNVISRSNKLVDDTIDKYLPGDMDEK